MPDALHPFARFNLVLRAFESPFALSDKETAKTCTWLSRKKTDPVTALIDLAATYRALAEAHADHRPVPYVDLVKLAVHFIFDRFTLQFEWKAADETWAVDIYPRRAL